jgi:hypothetical protein
MGILRHDSTGTDLILGVRRVGVTILDEESIDYYTIFLMGEDSELVMDLLSTHRIRIEVLIGIEEIVGEGHDMEGISFRAGRRSDLTGEDGTIGQRVAVIDELCAGTIQHYCSVFDIMEVAGLIATLDLNTMRDDKGVVQRIVVIAR